MGFKENIHICHGCPHRQHQCKGPCPCLADDLDEHIISKAKRHACPLELFPSRGLGDTIAKITHATGIAKAVEAVSKATGIPCNCPERQAALNEAVPYKDEKKPKEPPTSP
jgi:hypothetical protein